MPLPNQHDVPVVAPDLVAHPPGFLAGLNLTLFSKWPKLPRAPSAFATELIAGVIGPMLQTLLLGRRAPFGCLGVAHQLRRHVDQTGHVSPMLCDVGNRANGNDQTGNDANADKCG